jgi:hypothetical protein
MPTDEPHPFSDENETRDEIESVSQEENNAKDSPEAFHPQTQEWHISRAEWLDFNVQLVCCSQKSPPPFPCRPVRNPIDVTCASCPGDGRTRTVMVFLAMK